MARKVRRGRDEELQEGLTDEIIDVRLKINLYTLRSCLAYKQPDLSKCKNFP